MPISKRTRTNIIQTLIRENVQWYGSLDDVEFLSRIYDLINMSSYDGRFQNAKEDIWQHTINNPGDWDDNWVYTDERFNLYECPDDEFLRFLCEMVHPVVRPDENEAGTLVELFNQELREEGYEIIEKTSVFGNTLYEATGITPTTIDALNQLRDLANTLNSEYINKSIVRMLTAVKDDPELAIGSAKELVETICKTILDEKGVARTDRENVPRLVGMTLDAIKPANEFLIDQESEQIVIEAVTALATIALNIAQLRNKHGTGHGKDAEKVEIDTMYATLAVNAASTIALFFYQAWEKYNT
ncbi:abortive infection family protein [Thermoproteota archaeon]